MLTNRFPRILILMGAVWLLSSGLLWAQDTDDHEFQTLEELTPLGEMLQDTVFNVNIDPKGGNFGFFLCRGEDFFVTTDNNMLWLHDKFDGQTIDSVKMYYISEYHKSNPLTVNGAYAQNTKEIFVIMEDTLRAYRLPSLEMTYENKMIDTMKYRIGDLVHRTYLRDISADGTTIAFCINYTYEDEPFDVKFSSSVIVDRESGERKVNAAEWEVLKNRIILSQTGRVRAELLSWDTGDIENSYKWMIVNNQTEEVLDEISTGTTNRLMYDEHDNPVFLNNVPDTFESNVVTLFLDDNQKTVTPLRYNLWSVFPLNDKIYIAIEEGDGKHYATWIDITNSIIGGQYIGDHQEYVSTLLNCYLSDDNRLYKLDWRTGNIMAIQLSGDFPSVMESIMPVSGIKESETEASLYPNPAGYKVTLFDPSVQNGQYAYHIINTLGQDILSGEIRFNNGNAEIEIGDLPSGQYTLIYSENLSVRFIVE